MARKKRQVILPPTFVGAQPSNPGASAPGGSVANHVGPILEGFTVSAAGAMKIADDAARVAYLGSLSALAGILEQEAITVRNERGGAQGSHIESLQEDIAARSVLLGRKTADLELQQTLANSYYGSSPFGKSAQEYAHSTFKNIATGLIKITSAQEALNAAYRAAYMVQLREAEIQMLQAQIAALQQALNTAQEQLRAEAEAQARAQAEAEAAARAQAEAEAAARAQAEAEAAARAQAEAEAAARAQAEAEAAARAQAEAEAAARAQAEAEAAARAQAEAEAAARAQAEAEAAARAQAEAEAAARAQAEAEAAARAQAEAEAAARAQAEAEAAARAQAEAEAAARAQAEAEAAARAQAEAEAAARAQAEAEAAARAQAEAEAAARAQAEAEAAARAQAEAEAAARAQAEAEAAARAQAEAEAAARAQAEAEAAARAQAEAEAAARAQAEAEAAARAQAEAEAAARAQAEAEAAARAQAEAEAAARAQAEAEAAARAQAEAEAAARAQAEAEAAARAQAEAEAAARAQAEAEAAARAQAEAEAAARAQAEAEAAARAQAEAEAAAQAQAEAEAARLANTFTMSGASAIGGPLVVTTLGHVVSTGLNVSLSVSMGAALAALRGAAGVAVPFVAGAAALLYSSRLGNGELPGRYVLQMPLVTLDPQLSLALAPGVAIGSHAELPYRFSSQTTEAGDSEILVVKTDGQVVPSKVRVLAATHDQQSNLYSAATADVPPRTFTWTPIAQADNASTSLPAEQSELAVYDGATLTPAEVRVDGYPEVADASLDDYIIVFPADSGLPPLYVMFRDRREEPGTMSGFGQPDATVWLAGANQGLGVAIPPRIADKLRGRNFSNWRRAREAIWTAVSEDSVLMDQFSKSNQTLLRNGYSPSAIPSEHAGSNRVFEIHHVIPLKDGGAVYDIDNLRITTPKNHVRIHRNKGADQ
ncbi:S-type pyocin domain-containing protein [Pseudomonas vlassakiae]|uniref:S-type pyocin domain-containing protein n=3 Tax=Pseudomonas vlassakiae TaxID=485888 RepID=A0ABS6R8N9_9PSED|nr:S-type pyocin domain-containing protein [Pseudomonas vlassakiae]MBV4542480.1 S-type pyocin domain-containing protein [Pseudomonas vlassakiae]